MPEKNCPACRTSPLVPAVVESGLVGFTCHRCRGHWVPAEAYWAWAERPPSAPAVEGDATLGTDSGPAKRCADCGHFLAHLPVGHGTAFHIDRCSTCGGLWFDAGEWAELRRLGFAPHQVCAPAWQAAVARDARAAAQEADALARLGAADYAEAQRVRAWIASHPHRAALLAYLTPAEGLPPGKKAAGG